MRLREQLGLTVSEYADFLGTDESSVAKWEKHNVSPTHGHTPKMIYAIEQFLKEHPEKLDDLLTVVKQSLTFGSGYCYFIYSLLKKI